MERETKKKRISRERGHEKKKDQNLFKNAKKLEFRLRHHLELDNLDDGSKDQISVVVGDDNLHHPCISSSSSSLSSSSSSPVVKVDHVDNVFDFPWLKDADAMFKADDVDTYTTSLEELIQQQMLAPAAYNSYLFHDQHVRLGNHEDYLGGDHDHKFKCNHEELDKMEHCIWSSVLDQPLDTGMFNKLL